MTKIKICGLTRAEDALLCAEKGADFLGFIFVPSTPRFVEPEKAATIAAPIRERETRPRLVGVFRDASAEYMREIASLVGLDMVQLHGSESDDDIRAIGLPAIKTFRVSDALPDTSGHTAAEWFLFDTFDERRTGGTGRRFDWSLMATYPRNKPFFLAGGLAPDNIAAAISLVRPDAIDIASGVEAEPGVKDHAKVESLFQRVRRS
ncbi:MAG TPA: phosphoribosylanthranilate isomerase [Thermoanaerobaculia bacterium]|jgi:phosphoribosylanthranilate isomerase|nr:phosphoribosylanthranilate isomerase [Thermoanaerobaculia bacterium]